MQLTLLVHSLNMSNVALIYKESYLLLYIKTRLVINAYEFQHDKQYVCKYRP
jgi:ABC-type enterochelin transport system permease subunit